MSTTFEKFDPVLFMLNYQDVAPEVIEARDRKPKNINNYRLYDFINMTMTLFLN